MTGITCIRIVQQTKYRYTVLTPAGHVLIEEITFATPFKASEWARNYVSTWPSWGFKLELKEKI